MLTTINFNDTPAASNNGEIKKISISGNLFGSGGNNYREIKNFIASVETNLRLLDVDSVLFNPNSSAYSLTILAYYY